MLNRLSMVILLTYYDVVLTGRIPLPQKTRKLCYRKDDRAMRFIHGCPENFRDSLTTPTAIIPNIFHWLLFQSTLWMFLQNLKSVALPVPEIIGGDQKIWTVPGYIHAPLSPKFLTGFYSDWPCKCTAKFEVCKFTCSWDNRGYPKNLGSAWMHLRSICSKIFNGLLFRLVP